MHPNGSFSSCSGGTDADGLTIGTTSAAGESRELLPAGLHERPGGPTPAPQWCPERGHCHTGSPLRRYQPRHPVRPGRLVVRVSGPPLQLFGVVSPTGRRAMSPSRPKLTWITSFLPERLASSNQGEGETTVSGLPSGTDPVEARTRGSFTPTSVPGASRCAGPPVSRVRGSGSACSPAGSRLLLWSAGRCCGGRPAGRAAATGAVPRDAPRSRSPTGSGSRFTWPVLEWECGACPAFVTIPKLAAHATGPISSP